MTLQAKKAAEDASKQALQASKHAADASKNTFEDLTYVGKSTIGDLTKTAKEAATKKGLIHNNAQSQKQFSPPPSVHHHQQQQPAGNALVTHSSGRDFFSTFSSEINGIASSTSSMFSDLFGKSKIDFYLYPPIFSLVNSSINISFVLQKTTRKIRISNNNKKQPKKSCCHLIRFLVVRHWWSALLVSIFISLNFLFRKKLEKINKNSHFIPPSQ